MSDHAHYKLEVQGYEGDAEFLMFKLRKAVPDAKHFIDEEGESTGNGNSWRELEEDGEGTMRAFSRQYPEVLFIFREDGVYEDSYEMRHYIRKGKYYLMSPEVVTTWPEFNGEV